MASAKTAQQLVKATRDLVGVYSPDKLGDGFPSDAETADRTILPQVNRAITELLSTGLIKCRFYLRAATGTGEYRLDPACGLIEYVKFRGRVLPKSSLARDNRDNYGYASTLNNIPTTWGAGGITLRQGAPAFWYNDISDVLGLSPVPDVTDTVSAPPAPLTDPAPSIEILAEALASDLVNPSDIPDRIPVQFHDDLAIGAAYWVMLGMMGGADTDPAGPGPTDPSQIPIDARALKLQELSRRWGTPDDVGESSTVFARVKRFANQRAETEITELSPGRQGYPYNLQGRVPGIRY